MRKSESGAKKNATELKPKAWWPLNLPKVNMNFPKIKLGFIYNQLIDLGIIGTKEL